MAPMVKWNFSRLLNSPEEVDKLRPIYCTWCRIPVLDFVNRMDWYQFLRLYLGPDGWAYFVGKANIFLRTGAKS